MGRSLPRQEDPRLLRGKGRYVGDVVLPGLLHLAVVRSPHAHARIGGIDVRAALVSPGVVAVLTASDLEGIGVLPVLAHPPGQRQNDFPVLPVDRAVYAGQPVAAVVAEDRYAAEDALDAVRIDWERQPVLTDVVRATAPGAPRLYETWPDNVAVGREIGPGIPEGVFESAHTVVEAAFTTPRQTAAPLEGRAICASWDADAGALTVWASSQAPHQLRTVLADVLALDEERIRVIVPDVGGGFGAKLHYYPEDVLACVAAMRLGRPVRWIEDRREHFVATRASRRRARGPPSTPAARSSRSTSTSAVTSARTCTPRAAARSSSAASCCPGSTPCVTSAPAWRASSRTRCPWGLTAASACSRRRS